MQVFLRKFCSVITSFNHNVAIVVILFTNFTLSAVACALFNMRFMIYFFLKSASNLNGNLNGSKELEHYAS